MAVCAARPGAKRWLSYRFGHPALQPPGAWFWRREDKRIGNKAGLFCARTAKFNDAGNADVDWFRID